MWDEDPRNLAEALKNAGSRRALIAARPADDIYISHDALQPLAGRLVEDPDYDRHAACLFELGAESDHLLAGFIHRTERGQAAGGVRFWSYPRLGSLINDGLRLSRAMGQKNALAGLWWGGGKGIIAREPGRDYDDARLRTAIFRDYGRFISGIAGCYVTAEDVGTRPADMAAIFSTTRHTTCIPPVVGGSGNPGVLTARGVVVAMEAALAHCSGDTLAGKVIAMQGAGNVAQNMIATLLKHGIGKIIASDIDTAALDKARNRFADAPVELRQAEADNHSILATPCDILAPNAVGGILNPDTIPVIRAPIVCGAANNQLRKPDRDAVGLQQRDILYVPDFLANRMGIVNCANEQYGVICDDPAVEKHLDRHTPEGVYCRLLEVLARAEHSGRPPAHEAAVLADELAAETHPAWPGRGQEIIDSLIASNWAEKPTGTIC
ncbi:MAG: hypothetical protein KJO54_07185 [Gammaproteobacteria bacterium]|nr:hypothetical protein [Gammaproteobacteria bacterium]NNF62393.1 Glu/Leu/Phe/Val dehydrogenase [Gammaproteobacteria bacterium]NNM20917.1 Glu/Leu/Phe/Val dehydrogenase [Gammaproteobacteria bacterium]